MSRLDAELTAEACNRSYLPQSLGSAPCLPHTGSLDGNGSAAILATASGSGACLQISHACPGGYAPTTRKSRLASSRQCPVPVDNAATSPPSTTTSCPFSPPSI